MIYVTKIITRVGQAIVYTAEGIWGFIGSANILVPIGIFIAEKLIEFWRTCEEPVYDTAQIQALLTEKGF